MVTEEHVGATAEPSLRDLSEALIAVYGTDYGIHSPTWISRFTDLTRQAASYRKGRVLLALKKRLQASALSGSLSPPSVHRTQPCVWHVRIRVSARFWL